MFPSSMVLNLPDWYRLERETEKTIGKLINLKELDYYLRNPDENLRRLAIIRLSQYKPRDCENILREILEDHYESNENKELAAWVLKAVAAKWKLEIFIDNRYLTKFTGSEKLEDIHKITFGEVFPSLRFNFAKNTASSQLPAAEDNINYEGRTAVESGFDTSQWLAQLSKNILTDFKSLLLNMLKIMKKALGGLLKLVFIKLPVLLATGIGNIFKRRAHPTVGNLEKRSLAKSKNSKNSINSKNSYISNSDNYSRLASISYNNPDLMPLIIKSQRAHNHKPSVISSLMSSVKKTVFNVLYVIFYPVRLILKYKLAMVFILLALYVFVNFTNQGIILFREYTGKDFLEIQTQAVNNVKQFSLGLWSDFKELSGLNDVLAKQDKEAVKNTDPGITAAVRYLVTATKGLNIRTAPDPNSEKITGGSLAFGSIVTFLDKTMTDSAGRIWFYIKSEDGRSGWVSAKYLEEKKEG